MPEKFQDFMSSLGMALDRLGTRRLVALGLIGAALFAAVLLSAFYLTRPGYETLYIGLSRDDVNRMGMALGEAGIAFDVSSDGTVVQVPVGSAEKTRMFLAGKGLPTSNNAGYELFDKMGSLGLTSFMQEITRQRALEGEIARTIQAVQGVKAARIHIVLPEKSSFRRVSQKPTASVVIRTGAGFAPESAQAIRHLVASAVPSMEASAVTVLDATGQLLASENDVTNGASVRMAVLEQKFAAQISENIRKQLMPYLGPDHFQASVQIELDTDRRQISETTYDPDSQVARSVRTTREQTDSQNRRNNDAVGVEQNIPQEEISSLNGENASDRRNRREEITNYEINARTVSTVSDGYHIKKLAVAVVVDRNRLRAGEQQGADSGKYIDEQIDSIRKMVAAAAGLDVARGDIINVTAVDFISASDDDAQSGVSAIGQAISRHIPLVVRSLALVAVILLILLLGVRPFLRDPALILKYRRAADRTQGATGAFPQSAAAQMADPAASSSGPVPGDLRRRMRVSPRIRLEQMLEIDEQRFISILQDWIRDERPARHRTV